MYHYAGNNPIKYTDPDGNAFCVVTAIIGAAVGGGLAAYDSYKRNNGKIKLGDVALGAAFGGAIGLGIGLIGAQVATSTALQAGNCLAGFSEVTGWGMAATGGAAAAGGVVAAGTMENFFSIVGDGISTDAQNFTLSIVDTIIKDPKMLSKICMGLVETAKTQTGRHLLSEVHIFSSRLINCVNNPEAFNALKIIQDYSGSLSGGIK